MLSHNTSTNDEPYHIEYHMNRQRDMKANEMVGAGLTNCTNTTVSRGILGREGISGRVDPTCGESTNLVFVRFD